MALGYISVQIKTQLSQSTHLLLSVHQLIVVVLRLSFPKNCNCKKNMAQSRLEKIGTIFSRVTNLVKGGILKQEELPVWYAVYKAFPPKYEPRYDRPGSQTPVRNIYYAEDFIRAKFYKDFPGLTVPELTSNKPTKCQQFIDEYRKLEKEGIPEGELYKTTKEKFVSMLETDRERVTSVDSQNVKHVKKPKSGIDVTKFLGEST